MPEDGKKDPQVVLGIDPGTNLCGYGVLEVEGRKMKVIAAGTLDLHRIDDRYYRLGHLLERVTNLITTFKPASLAIEAAFYGKNVQSMLKLGRAQGVVMAVASDRGVPIYEYSPREVKKSITGMGSASKQQVAKLLEGIVGCKMDFPTQDASDGLAVAVCHAMALLAPVPYNTHKQTYTKAGGKSWGDFARQNPDKIAN